MNFKKICFTFYFLIFCLICTACKGLNNYIPDDSNKPSDGITNGDSNDSIDDNDVSIIEPDSTKHTYTLISQDNGMFTYRCEDCGDEAVVTITCLSGTTDAYEVEGNTITFKNITEESSYDISGVFYGNLIIDVSEDYKFELQMTGLELYSFTECPLTILSGDKVTISAKKSTENYVYDMREVVDEADISASIYAMCDLNVQGKGNLTIKSLHNNGIHTKDDLNVKNLSLQVDCKDNALKGNDSVTVESGSITLIARQGDGIKTSNSDISSKGNQRGTVAITGGDILIYAACDGIDAAYDVTIDESSATVNIQIFTDKYSIYSEEVTAVADSVYYIRFSSAAYQYSLKFYNDDSDFIWCNSSSSNTIGMYYYYPIAKPSGYAYFQFFIYNSSQQQGQSEEYLACSDQLAVNDNYDTIALQLRSNTLSYSWTNYTTNQGSNRPGGMGGFGGMNDGNTDKGDYSTKGIKADNAINISAGKITIHSYDDAIHANNDVELENGEVPMGNVTITGGILSLSSNDDGIHGDGVVLLAGGTINIINSYEGIEGNSVQITGGEISVNSSDDGINGTATSGTGITISGGKLYICAGGDGVDSNSTTSYSGIIFSGGFSVIISTGNSDSSIDTERGYTYTGGYVVGINRSGGMGNESTNCANFTQVGTSKTLSLQKEGYLVVNDIVTIEMPVSLNALVVCLGKASASISSSSSTGYELDSNGIYWNVI